MEDWRLPDTKTCQYESLTDTLLGLRACPHFPAQKKAIILLFLNAMYCLWYMEPASPNPINFQPGYPINVSDPTRNVVFFVWP